MINRRNNHGITNYLSKRMAILSPPKKDDFLAYSKGISAPGARRTDYLEVDTYGINYHLSSADVEVTKRCFLKIVEGGLDYRPI